MHWLRLSAAVLLVAIATSVVLADDWPGFLGPRRNGISQEQGLIDAIPADGPQVVWRVRGGVGMSAVAVCQGLAVTTWNDAGKQWLVALEAATGKEAWKTPIGPAYENGMGNGPRATPMIAGERVYAFSGEGILVAVSRKDGTLLWQVDAVGEADAKPSDYGMASSPLVVGEQVIVHVGGAAGAIAAFSSADGQPAWKASAGTAGYSSPTLLEVAGVEQVVSVTGTEVVGLRPGTGDLLWRFPFKTDFACNTATPIAVDGGIFISAGENHGCVLIDLKPQGDGFVARSRWDSLDTKSVMRNEWQTSIVVGDHLYGFDNVGAAGPVTHLVCLEAKTGQEIWRKLRFGKGNMVSADGKLWITSIDGELILARATPAGYEEFGRAALLGNNRQTLTIAGGRGYLRDDLEVLCIGLK
ncbi:MAG: alcohol dehydrogenase [Planctomycetota bacterium]|nr:MAG: alcohol dehydrogenase [Planctomycetota bacterium]